MKGPLAVIGAGLAAIVCCVAGPAAIIAAIAAIGLSGATGGLTAALLAAAAVIALVAVRGARQRRRYTPDEAGPEQGRDRRPGWRRREPPSLGRVAADAAAAVVMYGGTMRLRVVAPRGYSDVTCGS